MKTKLLTLPLALIFLVAVVAAASSVTVSLFYVESSTGSLTINDGDSFGLIVSADSILENSMNVTVDVMSGNNVVTNVLDVFIVSDSYSNTLTVGKSAYLTPGTYTIRAIVRGASGQTATKTLTLNVLPKSTTNRLPVITSNPVTKVNENSNYVYDVDAIDQDGDTLTYSLTQKPVWLTINPQTGLITGTSPNVDANTQYAVTVSVSDGKGSVTQFYTIDVLNVSSPGQNHAPVITSSPVTQVVEGQNYLYDVNATDADGDTLVYSLENPVPNWLTINSQTGVISGKAPNVTQNTIFSVVVLVSDGKDKVNQAYTITVIDTGSPTTNHAPVITTTPVTSVNENSNYLYDVDATDADNDPLSYSLATAPAWLTINSQTGVISGVAPNVTQNTQYSVVVRVTDGKDIVSQSYTLTVVNVTSPPPTTNHLPVVTSTPVVTVKENTAYSYDVDATDQDGDTLVYSLTQAPTWLTINSQTGLITGTAPSVSSNTVFNVMVGISDGKGMITHAYGLTVLDSSSGGGNGGGGSSSKGKGSSSGAPIRNLPVDDFYNMQYLNGLNARPPVVLTEDKTPSETVVAKSLGFWGSALFWMFVLVVIIAIAVLIVWLRNA